jgi:hypothetical protein
MDFLLFGLPTFIEIDFHHAAIIIQTLILLQHPIAISGEEIGPLTK